MIRTFLTLLTKDPRSGPIQGTWRGDFGEGGPSNGSSFTLLGDLGTSSYSVLCSSELHCTSEIALSATGEGIMSFTYLLHIQVAGKERKEYNQRNYFNSFVIPNSTQHWLRNEFHITYACLVSVIYRCNS